MEYANSNKLEPWQLKIFAKNAKKGWRFFQPDRIETPIPRTAREAWGAEYKKDLTSKYEERNSKILVAFVVIILLVLSIL